MPRREPRVPSPRTPADLAESLRLSVTRLARILRHQDGGDLTPSTISALSTINRRGPLTLSELAAREHIGAPSVTRIADKLQQLGLVDRVPSPTDGRVAYVQVNESGRRLVTEARRRRRAWLAARLADLPAEDVDALRRAAPVLERLLEAAGDEVRT